MSAFSFSGGDKMRAKLAEMAKRLNVAGSVRVGMLEGGTEPDGATPTGLVAAVQEFGAPSRGIPPRPFFRTMIAKNESGWPAYLGDALIHSGYDSGASLKLLGDEMKGQLEDSIREVVGPPLKPATVKAKGFDKLLIDSGNMIDSIGVEVSK